MPAMVADAINVIIGINFGSQFQILEIFYVHIMFYQHCNKFTVEYYLLFIRRVIKVIIMNENVN